MEEKNKFNYRISDLYRGITGNSYYYDYVYDEKSKHSNSVLTDQDVQAVIDKLNKHLTDFIKEERTKLFKLWIIDQKTYTLPQNLTFGEIHATLDNIEERLAQLREQFSHENFKKD
jgi:hypothetical protein